MFFLQLRNFHTVRTISFCVHKIPSDFYFKTKLGHQYMYAIVCMQGVTQRYRLPVSWLTNSALVYEPKCGGRGELRGLSQ